MNADKIRAIDIAHNTRILNAMQVGQEYKTWGYVAQAWTKVTRTVDGYMVKAPKSRKAVAMSLEQAVDVIIAAHHA